MKNWFVKLPGGGFTLASDTPGADLIAKGYTEFALTEIPPRAPGAPLPDPTYQIPPEILSVAVEGLADLARMLELQAAGLALIQTREATLRAAELAEQADTVLQAAGVLGSL